MANINARLNHGRWIADCPVCKGAELVEPGQLFVCYSCFPQLRPGFYPKIRGEIVVVDKPSDYKDYEVVFPTNKITIDSTISLRPTVNKNWEVGEMLVKLNAENVAHRITAAKE